MTKSAGPKDSMRNNDDLCFNFYTVCLIVLNVVYWLRLPRTCTKGLEKCSCCCEIRPRWRSLLAGCPRDNTRIFDRRYDGSFGFARVLWIVPDNGQRFKVMWLNTERISVTGINEFLVKSVNGLPNSIVRMGLSVPNVRSRLCAHLATRANWNCQRVHNTMPS